VSDKRAQFFAGAAVLCLLLLPVAEDKFRDITLVVAVTYLVLAAASWLDHRSRH
jgi:hypothetical protein